MTSSGPFDNATGTNLYEYQFELIKQAVDSWDPSEDNPPLIVLDMWKGMVAAQFNRNPDLSIRCPTMQAIQQAARNSRTCPRICWFLHTGSLGCGSDIDVQPNQIGLVEHNGVVYGQIVHDHKLIDALKALGLVGNTSDITAIIVSKSTRDDDYWRNNIHQDEIGLIMWHESTALGLKDIIVNAAMQNKKKVKEYWMRQICDGQITARDLCLYFLRTLAGNVLR